MIADVNRAILGADFLHKYDLFIDINRHSLTDSEANIKPSGSVHNAFALCPSVANTEENPVFCKLLKKFANITKPSFHKETQSHYNPPYFNYWPPCSQPTSSAYNGKVE